MAGVFLLGMPYKHATEVGKGEEDLGMYGLLQRAKEVR